MRVPIRLGSAIAVVAAGLVTAVALPFATPALASTAVPAFGAGHAVFVQTDNTSGNRVVAHQEQMLRLAAGFVPSRAVAEEVVQDTWLAVLRGLDGFEGRSSLKTWLFSILVKQARTTGTRELRSVPSRTPSRPSTPPGSTRAVAGPSRPSTGSRPPRAAWKRASWPTGSGP